MISLPPSSARKLSSNQPSDQKLSVLRQSAFDDSCFEANDRSVEVSFTEKHFDKTTNNKGPNMVNKIIKTMGKILEDPEASLKGSTVRSI